MSTLRQLFILVMFSLLLAPQPGLAAEEGTLLKVVALSRHGVRAPTQSDKVLASWSQKTWPSWPVAKGDLTPRGARLITAMWGTLREKFINHNMLPSDSCPAQGSIYVRADVDERTKATARALLDGLAPGCTLGFAVANGEVDPLFHPVKAGLYTFDPISVATDVLSMTGGGLETLQENFSGTIALMSRISGPPAQAFCTRFNLPPNCRLEDFPNAISISPDGRNVRLVGSLSIASSMAEIFLLEYGEWPGVAAGWGQVNNTVLGQILPIHSRIFDTVNRAPVVAWARGSSLLSEMSEALLGTHYDQRANDAKIVVFVGHDTNIANVGALLGVNWRASGYPFNGIPPGGVLMLELWEKQGRRHVMARFFAQPPKALHAPFGEETGPAAKIANIESHAPVAASVSLPPVVGQASFSVGDFENLVNSATAGAPMAPRESPPLDFKMPVPKP